MTKTLSRRLERLEEQMMPISEPTVLQIVYVDSAGNRTDGPKFEIPSYGPAHDRRRRCHRTHGKQERKGYFLHMDLHCVPRCCVFQEHYLASKCLSILHEAIAAARRRICRCRRCGR